MAFLSTESLKKLLLDNKIIVDDHNMNIYSESKVEQAAYALCLGSEVYRTDNEERKVEYLDNTNKTVEINPGQFALLMTKEIICVPQNLLALISIKAKHKLKGLVNVSGFHVDPGFKGKLLFSVYNAGPSTITLETDKPYFLIWFANLDKAIDENDQYNSKINHHQGQNSINIDYIDALKRGELASPNALLKRIEKNEDSVQRFLWIAVIVSTIVASIAIKVWWDNDQFFKGYKKGIEEQIVKLELNKKNIIFTNDSIKYNKSDSLIYNQLRRKNGNQN